ncbi:MAG: AraC family transcriptional regulator [Balneolaceae bacterium]
MFIENPKPGPPIDTFVDCFIYFKGYMPQHSIERVVPDGHVYLIFELDDLPRHTYNNETLEKNFDFTKCWLSGLQKNYISISALPDSEMFVIRFKPGGAIPYLHRPLDEVSNSVIPAEELFGDSIFQFRDQLLAAETPADKYAAAERFLSARFDPDYVPDESVYKVIDSITCNPEFFETNMLELIKDSGFSKKHFIDLFRKVVGVTPKYFQRILRFNCILPKVQQEEDISWPQISAECGFYDQAHFIKEFKTFSGFNPGAFLTEQKGHGEVNFFPIK